MDEKTKKYIQDALDIIGDGFNVAINDVSFEICNYSDKNIATDKEWATITLFFNHIKEASMFGPNCIDLAKEAKNVLNDMRPVLMNEDDSIYYSKIIQIIEQMMIDIHETQTHIIAVGPNETDMTDLYKSTLKELKKHITKIIKCSDFKYVYNGLLQHTDSTYGTRFLTDNKEGLIPCIYIKNAILASYIAKLLTSFLEPLFFFYANNNA